MAEKADHSNAMQKTTIKNEIGFIKLGSTNKPKYSLMDWKLLLAVLFSFKSESIFFEILSISASITSSLMESLNLSREFLASSFCPIAKK